MADNVTLPAQGTGSTTPIVAADEATYSGDTAQIQLVQLAFVSGAEGSRTVGKSPGDSTSGYAVQGSVAHDGVNAGNPVQIGVEAIAHGTNPTAVAAADRTKLYANRAGIPFVIGGHPNVKAATYITTGAQTDDGVLAAISSGTKYVITRITITLDEAATVGVAIRLGFGTSTIPALGASGADGVDDIIVYHPGLVPGGGITIGDGSGIIAVGADGAELRITCEAPTSGTLVVSVSYYTIES
jgi:hypothetical protein